jgi:hypothetical protein
MNKVDLKLKLKHLYKPGGQEYTIVEVPRMNFLMVDGAGDPNTASAYQEAVQTLYTVAYALKFAVKKQQATDYGVMPLEGLWWTSDGNYDPLAQSRDNWRWTMMIMQPEFIGAEMVSQIMEEVKGKKNPPAIDLMRFAPYDEGLAAQVLYTGPYADEYPVIEGMHHFMQEQGYLHNGKHHEIYLSDPNRTAPERLKTILRQPIRAR